MKQRDLQHLSQREAAELLGIAPRTLRDRGDAPRNADGSYSGTALVAWEVERRTVSAGDLDPVQELARKNKALADKTEMEIAVRVGELGVISEVADWYGDHIARCKARLIQLPDAIGQFCDPRNAAVVVAEARRLVYEGMAELAADRTRLNREDAA